MACISRCSIELASGISASVVMRRNVSQDLLLAICAVAEALLLVFGVLPSCLYFVCLGSFGNLWDLLMAHFSMLAACFERLWGFPFLHSLLLRFVIGTIRHSLSHVSEERGASR